MSSHVLTATLKNSRRMPSEELPPSDQGAERGQSSFQAQVAERERVEEALLKQTKIRLCSHNMMTSLLPTPTKTF